MSNRARYLAAGIKTQLPPPQGQEGGLAPARRPAQLSGPTLSCGSGACQIVPATLPRV
jgi:hypothetical protein